MPFKDINQIESKTKIRAQSIFEKMSQWIIEYINPKSEDLVEGVGW